MSKFVTNKSNKSLSIPNCGIAEPGQSIEVPDDFNNPNFEVAKSGEPATTGSEEEKTTPKKGSSK